MCTVADIPCVVRTVIDALDDSHNPVKDYLVNAPVSLLLDFSGSCIHLHTWAYYTLCVFRQSLIDPTPQDFAKLRWSFKSFVIYTSTFIIYTVWVIMGVAWVVNNGESVIVA
jgi:hypothetical protein